MSPHNKAKKVHDTFRSKQDILSTHTRTHTRTDTNTHIYTHTSTQRAAAQMRCVWWLCVFAKYLLYL